MLICKQREPVSSIYRRVLCYLFELNINLNEHNSKGPRGIRKVNNTKLQMVRNFVDQDLFFKISKDPLHDSVVNNYNMSNLL